jgi:hypothetical protein
MYEPQADFGTPAPRHQTVPLAEPVTLTIDGHSVTVGKGTSVMRAAALAGIKVPRLCATDSLDAEKDAAEAFQLAAVAEVEELVIAGACRHE